MRRWTRRLTLVMLASLAIAALGASSALASCPVLDVTCRADEVVGTGEGLASDVIDLVDIPVDTPADDLVDPVIDIIDPVVDGLLGRVNDLPGGGQVDPPDLGGGGGSHVGRPPASDHAQGSRNPTAVPLHRNTLVRGGPRLSGPTGSSTGDDPSSARGAPSDRTSGDRFRAALGGVARSLAMVLALFGLTVAFVALQDRLDRSDPRLALAPVESDVVEFA